MSLVVVYLAARRDEGWLQWTRRECLFASLVLLRHMRPLPVIVFHEDYNDDDKAFLRTTADDLTFERVDFSGHEDHYVDRRPGERVGSYGYCMMSRFFSGVMQRHPLLQSYSHYMRLDDDSYIIGRIEDKTIRRMLGYDYSYSRTFCDPYEDLWEFSIDFMKRRGIETSYVYSDNAPYTNFHVSSLALWRHPVIEAYVDELEAVHGCVRYRWDDAQTHAVIAFALAPALGLTLNLEREFPYRHNQQCVHEGPHSKDCVDGTGKAYSWGPPVL